MRSLKLDDIVKEASRFVATSGIHEQLDPSNADIAEIYYILEVTGLLPQITTKSSKSDYSSERFRSSGNNAFIILKNDMEALRLYTQAIGSALSDGKAIALAYANRSAVTFALQEYESSIMDIDRALCGNYPGNLHYKLVERKGRCYLALSQYQRAAREFEKAKNLLRCSSLSNDKINNLDSQIKALIEECTGRNDNLSSTFTESPQLTYTPSKYIECSSSAIDITYSEQMGRHVIAAKDIYPGDVLAIEKPYASVLLPSSYDLFCDCCKKRCHSSIPCLYCIDIMYCDEQCRQIGWSAHHSIECDILPSMIAIGCDKMEFLAVRVLLAASNCGEELHNFVQSPPDESIEKPELKGFVNNQYLSDDYCSTHNLETNREARSCDDIFRRGVIAACMLHILKESSSFFDVCNVMKWKGASTYIQLIGISNLCSAHVIAGDAIMRYLMSVPCNAHEIAEMRVTYSDDAPVTESTEIGGAIYPFHSLINHSCDPNVVRHAYNGDTVVLSSIQKIKQGEQIFDNYGYHHAIHDLTTRQQHLSSQYYFTCYCQACRDNWPLYSDLPDGPPSYMTSDNKNIVDESSNKFAKVLIDIKNAVATDENMNFLTKYLTLLHENVKRPWKGYNKCQEAIKQCLSLKANHYIYKKLF